MQTPGYGSGGPNDPNVPPYGTPGSPGGGRSVNGTLLLILGIVGILCCNILGPIVWVMSNSALATINSGEGAESERGQVNTARILGMVGTGLLVVGILWGLTVGVNVFRTMSQMPRNGTPPTFQTVPAPPVPAPAPQ